MPVNKSCNRVCHSGGNYHYNDVIMSAMASQITGVSIVYSIVCSGADQRKHHWPLWGEFTVDRWLVNSPHHKGPMTRKCMMVNLMTSSWLGQLNETLSIDRVTPTHLKIGYPWMKFIMESQWPDKNDRLPWYWPQHDTFSRMDWYTVLVWWQ